MRKGILFFVLTIIFLSLAVFLIKALFMQKNSDNDGNTGNETNQNAVEVTETPSYYKNYSKEDYGISEKQSESPSYGFTKSSPGCDEKDNKKRY